MVSPSWISATGTCSALSSCWPGVVLPGLVVCGDCGEVQGLPVSDRGHRARGVAVSPFRAEPARRRGADACPRCGGHPRDDPVLVCDVRAGLRRPVTSAATPPRRQMVLRLGGLPPLCGDD